MQPGLLYGAVLHVRILDCPIETRKEASNGLTKPPFLFQIGYQESRTFRGGIQIVLAFTSMAAKHGTITRVLAMIHLVQLVMYASMKKLAKTIVLVHGVRRTPM